MSIKNYEDKLKLKNLYIKYSKLMYKVAYNILNNKYDSEDVVQLSFIKVIKNLDKLNKIESEKIVNFLIIVCRNTAIDFYNKKNLIN